MSFAERTAKQSAVEHLARSWLDPCVWDPLERRLWPASGTARGRWNGEWPLLRRLGVAVLGEVVSGDGASA